MKNIFMVIAVLCTNSNLWSMNQEHAKFVILKELDQLGDQNIEIIVHDHHNSNYQIQEHCCCKKLCNQTQEYCCSSIQCFKTAERNGCCDWCVFCACDAVGLGLGIISLVLAKMHGK